jgi:pyrimidine-nucleoside phosphorylase
MITPALIIQKKRDGKELSSKEIHSFIKGILTGDVADYQATAFLMAVYFKGMTLDETVALTEAMLHSGERYDLSHIPGAKVDKHSTGGVGDKVSLILAPLASACGVKVPMMSGRGLGHTGGTLDKLESITGFDVRLPREKFEDILSEVGAAMIGQSEKIAPADKKLYALRDVTGTVECIPLIVASILSKKAAEGTEGLVLDVKVGNGAFMKSKEDAKKLARTLTSVAKKMGLKCRALLTNMDQPLGYAVGNSLEVLECIEIMKNERCAHPASGKPQADLTSCDLKELTIHLCAHMVELAGITRDLTSARKLAHAKLADGSAWNVFHKMVEAHGGEVEQILDPRKLPFSKRHVKWTAKKRGYITAMDTEMLGRILVEMGGGRKKASDSVDPRVGMVFHKKLGAKVKTGETIATVYAPDKRDLKDLEEMFDLAIEIRSVRKPVPKLIYDTMG